ncbi:MAG: phage tail protein [Alphaproteobacteria bacterium]
MTEITTSLNAIMGVNMMILLGTYRFCISTAAYQSFSRTSEYKWEEVNRLQNENTIQFTGKTADIMTLSGEIYPHFKGGLLQIPLMRTEAIKGTPLMLISGNGTTFGRWCILSIEEKQKYFLQDGTPRKISFNIKLKKYGETQELGYKGIISSILEVL